MRYYSSRETNFRNLLTAWCARLAGQGDHPLLCVQSAWAGAMSGSSTEGPVLTFVHSSCYPSWLLMRPLTLRAMQAKLGAQAGEARVIIHCCVLQSAWGRGQGQVSIIHSGSSSDTYFFTMQSFCAIKTSSGPASIQDCCSSLRGMCASTALCSKYMGWGQIRIIHSSSSSDTCLFAYATLIALRHSLTLQERPCADSRRDTAQQGTFCLSTRKRTPCSIDEL